MILLIFKSLLCEMTNENCDFSTKQRHQKNTFLFNMLDQVLFSNTV